MAAASPDIQVEEPNSETTVEEPTTDRFEAPSRSVASSSAQSEVESPRSSPSIPPGGLGALGVLTLLLGVWDGLVPFVGPSLGFSADGSASWCWDLSHAVLWLVPGAVITVSGLVMLGLVPRALAGLARLGSAATGLIVAACGAWLVIGPLAWPVVERSRGPFVTASPLRELAYQVGYSLGPGLLLGIVGALAVGWAVRSRRRDRTAAVAP